MKKILQAFEQKNFHQNRFMHQGAMRKVRFARYISVIMKRSAQWIAPLRRAYREAPEWVDMKNFWSAAC